MTVTDTRTVSEEFDEQGRLTKRVTTETRETYTPPLTTPLITTPSDCGIIN